MNVMRRNILENQYQELINYIRRNPDFSVERSIEPYSLSIWLFSNKEYLCIEPNGDMYISDISEKEDV